VTLAGPSATREALYDAGDIAVQPSRWEGVGLQILEAMACGLPVVTTDVGGNAEVVSRADLGRIIAFDDHDALLAALEEALMRNWDREAILAHAHANTWDGRVATLVDEFTRIAFASPDMVAARSLQGGRP
jgi:glycosyltransferase involved in cell wall biosynthesis